MFEIITPKMYDALNYDFNSTKNIRTYNNRNYAIIMDISDKEISIVCWHLQKAPYTPATRYTIKIKPVRDEYGEIVSVELRNTHNNVIEVCEEEEDIFHAIKEELQELYKGTELYE